MKKTVEELKKKYNINEGHYTEMLDRAHNMCAIMEVLIGEHILIDIHPELKEHYDKMLDLAAEFYQLAGNVDFVENATEEEKSFLKPIVKDMPDNYEMDN